MPADFLEVLSGIFWITFGLERQVTASVRDGHIPRQKNKTWIATWHAGPHEQETLCIGRGVVLCGSVPWYCQVIRDSGDDLMFWNVFTIRKATLAS